MKKILVFTLILFFASFKHPIYISVTDLKYNSNQNSLQGSVKLFINDIEDALKKITKQSVDLVNPKDTTATNKILADYLRKHLLFKINGKASDYDYIGFEKEQEVIWLYIEFKKCRAPKRIELENSLLYDFLSDQMNIVHAEVNGNEKSFKVNNPEKTILFDF